MFQDYAIFSKPAATAIAECVQDWRRKRSRPDAEERTTPRAPQPQFRRFMLTEVLTPGGTAEAVQYRWDDHYAEDRPFWTGGTFNVVDVEGKHRGRAYDAGEGLLGSIGLAVHHTDVDRWEVVTMQPMMMWLLAQVNQPSPGTGDPGGVAAGDATFDVDNVTLVQPIGGILNALPTNVSNAWGLVLADNDYVLLYWNESTTAWEAIDFQQIAAKLKWGKVQGTTDASAATRQTVSVKECAYDGTGTTGEAFDVYTPIHARKYVHLKTDDVVGYVVDEAGDFIIVTVCTREVIDPADIWLDYSADDELQHLGPDGTFATSDDYATVAYDLGCGALVFRGGHYVGKYYDNGAGGWTWTPAVGGMADPGVWP